MFKRSMCSVVAVLAVSNAAAATPCAKQPNWEAIAAQMVQQVARLQKGERAAILFTADVVPELVPQLREAIVRAGGIHAFEILRSTKSQAALWENASETNRAAAQALEDRAFVDALKTVDVLFWLPGGGANDFPYRWEGILGRAKKTRSVHFHWFMPSDGDEACRVQTHYENAMRVPPGQLAKTQQYIAQSLSGKKAKLTSAAGADLVVEVKKSARWMMNAGEMPREKANRAESVREREEEFPASATRTLEFQVSGTLVAILYDGVFDTVIHARVDKNVVTDLDGHGPGFEKFRQSYDAQAAGKERIGQLVIGVNSQLPCRLPSGFLPYFGTGAGCVSFRLGDQEEAGGVTRLAKHWTANLVIHDVSLSVDDHVLFEPGKLMLVP
jgi:hypothetical protein